jgi:1-acyl-sn-glycerol-3-phosphate acyltransferase
LCSYANPELEGRFRFGEGVPGPKFPYGFMRTVLQVVLSAYCRARVFNRHYEPASGGAVYVCNHQSFLDPMLMSYALRRPMNYMARDSLFRVPGFAQLITEFYAFPVKRGAADTGAMKEAMRRIKAGGQVVLFAEGTRTLDGRIGPFLPGVALLAQRVAKWTVPCVIDGAFESWPRTQKFPSMGNIAVQYAPAIPQEEAARHTPDEFIKNLRKICIDMQSEVRQRMGRPALKYD